MPSYHRRVRTALDAGHPVTGVFNANDATAAAEINAVNIDVPDGIEAMREYLATHDNRSNEGGDTEATLMLGRLVTVAEAEPYTDPFARAGVWEAGGSGSNLQIELNATSNKLIFGSAHSLSFNAKDSLTISGSSRDDGTQQIVSVSGQEIEVYSIEVSETLERVFRVYKNQDAKLLTRPQIQNARGILALLQGATVTIDFTNTEIGLAFSDMVDATVWKSADSTALVNFSAGKASYANQEGLGTPSTSDITAARAL